MTYNNISGFPSNNYNYGNYDQVQMFSPSNINNAPASRSYTSPGIESVQKGTKLSGIKTKVTGYFKGLWHAVSGKSIRNSENSINVANAIDSRQQSPQAEAPDFSSDPVLSKWADPHAEKGLLESMNALKEIQDIDNTSSKTEDGITEDSILAETDPIETNDSSQNQNNQINPMLMAMLMNSGNNNAMSDMAMNPNPNTFTPERFYSSQMMNGFNPSMLNNMSQLNMTNMLNNMNQQTNSSIA